MSGGTPSRSNEDFWSGKIPWISGSTLKHTEISTSDQFLTVEGVDAGSKMAPLNSTLLLVRGSALHNQIRAGLVVAPVCFNQDVKALVPNASIVPKYLTLYLLGMNNKLLKLVSSAGNSAGVLDTVLVQNFKFLKPPAKEQTAIANALSDVDNLIAALETLIAKKSAIKTAAMQQLLTGKKRLPAFEGKSVTASEKRAETPSREFDTPSNHNTDSAVANNTQTAPRSGYKQTELGEIPEDWEVRKLGDLVSITSGESPSKFVFVDSGIPYFKVEQLNNHKKYAVNTEYYLKASNTVEEGSIVFPKRGASILLNKIRIFKSSSFMDTNLMALTCSNELSNEFLFYYLDYKGLDSVADTTSIPQINNKHITPFLVPLIKKEEQTAIANVLSDMDTELDALQQRLSKTQKIKQGMMQELLTGKTRLVNGD
jgi:type I restriction enzyme S subunit